MRTNCLLLTIVSSHPPPDLFDCFRVLLSTTFVRFPSTISFRVNKLLYTHPLIRIESIDRGRIVNTREKV